MFFPYQSEIFKLKSTNKIDHRPRAKNTKFLSIKEDIN